MQPIVPLCLVIVAVTGACSNASEQGDAEPISGAVISRGAIPTVLSTYQRTGPLLSPASSAEDRASLVGTYVAKDEFEAAMLTLKGGSAASSHHYRWLRAHVHCGQFNEYSSGRWDLVDGEIQLFPAETATPRVTPDLDSSRILVVDGQLEWTFEGVSRLMSYTPDTFEGPSTKDE